MNRLLTLCLFVFGLAFQFSAKAASADSVTHQVDVMEDVLWQRFFNSRTHLFYDYISSYKQGEELAHLPTADEVKRQYPNPCGYGTGMEDCMILGGTMLCAIVNQYAVNPDDELRKHADRVFDGIKKCTLNHGVDGFVARGVCTQDGKSIYINSSRDQYTHCIHGLYALYNSPLCSNRQRKEIQTIVSDIAERMIRNVTPEHNYDFLRADDKSCPLGICKMWQVQPHEAARLPMIYAAAWQITKNQKYYQLYRSYIAEAIAQSENVGNQHSAYVFLQMQCSFELLYDLETDPQYKERIRKLMERVSNMAYDRLIELQAELYKTDTAKLAMCGPDWRVVEKWDVQNGYNIPRWGAYREVWNLIREIGECSLALYMSPTSEHREDCRNIFYQIVEMLDYRMISGCGIVFHFAAYYQDLK